MSKGKIGICRFCNESKYLPGGGTYCSTCYRKFIREKQVCKRCHRLKVIVANGYCGFCYNYIMGYYEKGKTRWDARIKRTIKSQKCYFCNEKRIEMLEVFQRKDKKLILLCPNHRREVQLGIKNL